MQNAEYGRTSLRHLLQMFSGVRFSEGYSGADFSYASAETHVPGLALAGPVGRPLAQCPREKIWEPMRAEADATWIVDAAGQEAAFCCLNAVLRDYARLALLLAHDGRLGYG